VKFIKLYTLDYTYSTSPQRMY